MCGGGGVGGGRADIDFALKPLPRELGKSSLQRRGTNTILSKLSSVKQQTFKMVGIRCNTST